LSEAGESEERNEGGEREVEGSEALSKVSQRVMQIVITTVSWIKVRGRSEAAERCMMSIEKRDSSARSEDLYSLLTLLGRVLSSGQERVEEAERVESRQTLGEFSSVLSRPCQRV
jgi:hypothetical protein